MNRSLRLLELLQLLRTYRTPVTALRLAATLEVTARTIYRDINTLRQQGNDIHGEGGIGYVLRSDNHLPPLDFNIEEINTLMLGLSWIRNHGDASLANTSEHIYAKIASVVPPHLKESLSDAPLMMASCHQYTDTEAKFAQQLRFAINHERQTRISYRDSKGVSTERIIHPLAVGFLEDRQIFASWCELRVDFRYFLLDGIIHLDILQTTYSPSRAFMLSRLKHEREIFPPLNQILGI